MQHPDEGTIHAWLDGELSAEETQALESHVAGCAECSARVAEARGLIAASSRIVSALDIVPAGVIPAAAKPIRRQWYSTVQFRAAAGLLVVIGASTLLFSKGQQKAARETLTVAQPVMTEAAATLDSRAAPDTTPVAADAAKATAPAAKPAPRPEGRRLKASVPAAAPEKISDAPAGVSVLQSPIAQTASPTANEAPQAVRRTAADKQVPLSGVVVTGVTTAGAMDQARPLLKVVKSDTTNVTVRNVYEVRQGVEVTLLETTLPQKNFGAASARRDRQAEPMASAPAPPPPQAKAMEAATNSITWSKGDKVFTLTGAVSKSELELIRLRLPEEKR